MINFRWGQAAGQASGFNLEGTRAISRGLRKDEGIGGRAGEKEGVQERGLRTPTLVSSVLRHPPPTTTSLPLCLPPNLAELSG